MTTAQADSLTIAATIFRKAAYYAGEKTVSEFCHYALTNGRLNAHACAAVWSCMRHGCTFLTIQQVSSYPYCRIEWMHHEAKRLYEQDTIFTAMCHIYTDHTNGHFPMPNQ